ncbi:hypothetical protein FRAAL0425 [Frankia alni ACN14a]|uniref:Uncharacterized protein n=1 Tax=Frankia alni (strain DSM 45986 / CECT 9034 / ACN14a) TaxID=326424 RepID=Q0RTJ8_FRAAA|nr:hypothetical protein FRAAL0425 [Frankia alni ACN14a]
MTPFAREGRHIDFLADLRLRTDASEALRHRSRREDTTSTHHPIMTDRRQPRWQTSPM